MTESENKIGQKPPSPKKRVTATRSRLLKRKFLSRRFLILTSLIGGIAFALGTVVSQALPKLKSLALVSIDDFSRKNLPVRILPGSVDFRFLPLGFTLNDVKILPTQSFVEANGQLVSAFTIQEVRADLSLFQIARGEVALDEVAIAGADFQVQVPELPSSGGKPLEGLFQLLEKVPITSLQLSDINARIEIPHQLLGVTLEGFSLNLSHPRFRAKPKIELQTAANTILVRKGPRLQNPGFVARLNGQMDIIFTPQLVEIQQLTIGRGSSSIELTGELNGDTEALKFDQGKLSLSSDLDVKSTRDWLQKSLRDAEPTPPMTGRMQAYATLQKLKPKSPWTADFKVFTQKYTVQNIDLDKIEASGKWDGEQFFIPLIASISQAGNVEAREIRIGEGTQVLPSGRSPWLMRIAKLSASIELHEFLTNMGIGPIPVWLTAQGEFPCESQLTPKFVIRCGGTFNGSNLIVQGDLKSGRRPTGAIVGIPNFTSNGEFTFDLEKFSYQAQIKFPNSIGKSQGEVRYKTGFDIAYEAENLALKDLSALGGLKIEGDFKLKGTTQGNSNSASLSMNLEGQNIWLEDFWLGQPKALTTYQKGLLKFSNLQGFYTTSRYGGDVKIDLRESTMETALRVPFFDSRDLFKVFSRKFTSPVLVTGTGQASIKSNGPFQISKMSYDLKSSLFKGTVAGETFDQMHFDVKSKNGNVKSERVSLTRGDAIIQLTGDGFPDGTIDTIVRGRGLRLEDTNFIAESSFGLGGLLTFDMGLKGPVLAPNAELKGSLTRTAIAETPMPDSEFELQFKAKTIEGRGQLLGNTVNGSFVWPLAPDAPMSVRFSSRDWNFANFVAAIGGQTGRRDFEGILTADVDLKSSSGGFWNSDGQISIDKLSLRRGPISIANEKKLAATMKAGNLNIKDFELVGDGTYLKIVNQSPSASSQFNRHIDVQISSKLDLNLMSIFTPFFEELRGLLSIAVAYKLGPLGSDVIGSAYVDRSYIKFPEFAYAFENLHSDLVFNQKKIVVNSLKSDFAGGKIQGTGNLELRGTKNYPVNLTGTFDRISLNIPDKVRTAGSGNFTFTGSYFPFLLKGDYVVREGLFGMELGGDTNARPGEDLRRDQFLPKFLLESSFQPVLLDLKVDFSKGIQVRNEQVEGSATGVVTIEGVPSKPRLNGIVRANPDTKIKFRENVFDVSSAILTFDDPLEINPRLNINARTRVETFDVNLQVTGTGKKPEMSVSSVPPMPERDIFSLLALGTTDRTLTENIGANQQGTGASQQLISGVANEALKGVTKNLGVDVQLSPGFDDTYEAYQKVVLKKQFNRRLDVSGSRSLGRRQETEAKLRYRFTDRVSGVISGKVIDQSETSDTAGQQIRNSEKVGLDFEYKFEFK